MKQYKVYLNFQTVLSCVSDAIFPQVRTCFDLLSSQGSFKRAYPTTIAALDTSLNGGIHSGHITEVHFKSFVYFGKCFCAGAITSRDCKK